MQDSRSALSVHQFNEDVTLADRFLRPDPLPALTQHKDQGEDQPDAGVDEDQQGLV